jgi:hypothetical protein
VDQQQQQTPQWSPPPQQPAGWGASGMAPATRPLGVTLSALWFYFIGVLGLLAGIIVIAGGTMLSDVFGSAAIGLGIALGAIALLFAFLFLLTGWGVWTGKGWGRILGIVLAILGVLGGLGQLTGQNGLVSGIVQIAIWGGIIYALWMAKAWFAAR